MFLRIKSMIDGIKEAATDMIGQNINKELLSIQKIISPGLGETLSPAGQLLRAVPLDPITNRETYRRYLKLLDFCFDILEEKKYSKTTLNAVSHYFDILSSLIGAYEKKHFVLPKATQAAMLEFLMDQHGLTQAELAKDLGGQPAVSNILNGKRNLNVRQIEKLSKRFGLSPATFFAD